MIIWRMYTLKRAPVGELKKFKTAEPVVQYLAKRILYKKNCDVCELVYNENYDLKLHDKPTLELDKIETIKSYRKSPINQENEEWKARQPVVKTVEIVNWAHSDKDASDINNTITAPDNNNARKEPETGDVIEKALTLINAEGGGAIILLYRRIAFSPQLNIA